MPETIDEELLRVRVLNIVCHYDLPQIMTDKIMSAIYASVLPVPYKEWEPELLKQEAAKAFAKWLKVPGDIGQLYLDFLNDNQAIKI